MKLIKYWFNPKYRVMSGVNIGDRYYMFIGANPIEPKDTEAKINRYGYVDKKMQNLKISFKNQESTFWKSNMYCRIWTFKSLMKWARLLPKNKGHVLRKTMFGFERI